MDEITLEVNRHRLKGIADEMGLVLQRASFSPNIKERKDFSCALVDRKGHLISQAAHIPVHLGAIPIIMDAVLDSDLDPGQGEGILVNDPYTGGTHLPDITYLMPWYVDRTIEGYVITRAHHTDIGGDSAGSMSVCDHIDQEGFRCSPTIVVSDGELRRNTISDLLEQSRDPDRRVTDLEAQVAAARRGLERLDEWQQSLDHGSRAVFDGLIDYAETYATGVFESMPGSTNRAEALMDSDGRDNRDITLAVEVKINDGDLLIDYTDTDDQVEGNINCPRAVTHSATYYVLQCLMPDDVPLNQGIFRRVDIRTRSGSILDVEYPGAVAGGNVETSQRIVDLLLKALKTALPEKTPAASQGTMNNISLGWQTNDGQRTYYETIGGGAGGGPAHPGLAGRHVHMTNTQNTPIEEFERNAPILIETLSLRRNSGGDGEHEGGDGIVKQWRALGPVDVSVLTERRRHGPYGLWGGEDGAPGRNMVLTDGDAEAIPSKTTLTLSRGEALRIETPGGGGWNSPEEKD